MKLYRSFDHEKMIVKSIEGDQWFYDVWQNWNLFLFEPSLHHIDGMDCSALFASEKGVEGMPAHCCSLVAWVMMEEEEEEEVNEQTLSQIKNEAK